MQSSRVSAPVYNLDLSGCLILFILSRPPIPGTVLGALRHIPAPRQRQSVHLTSRGQRRCPGCHLPPRARPVRCSQWVRAMCISMDRGHVSRSPDMCRAHVQRSIAQAACQVLVQSGYFICTCTLRWRLEMCPASLLSYLPALVLLAGPIIGQSSCTCYSSGCAIAQRLPLSK